MRSVPSKKTVVAGSIAAAIGALLIANFAPSSVSAPQAGLPVVEATVSPLAMMSKASLNLPVQQYDGY
jgi:hypothetical protein